MTKEERIAKVSATKQKQFQDSIKHVDLDELKKLYLDEDYSYEEIRKKYNLTAYTLDKILRTNNLKKPKKQSSRKGLETKYKNAGSKEKYFQKLKETTIQNLLAKGITWEEHLKQVSNSCKKSWNSKSESDIQTFVQSIRTNYFDIPEKIDTAKKKRLATNITRYGIDNTYKLSNYVCNSTFNKDFATRLECCGINYESEFFIPSDSSGHGFRYDFKIDNVLIEINPWPFHNSTWNPIDSSNLLDKTYHYNKTKVAKEHGYRCLNIWDWDDKDKIIKSLKSRKKLFARNCKVRKIEQSYIDDFLNTYHFQNTCKGQQYCYGLFQDDLLVQVMTFGKSRYNHNYEFELLRLCTRNDFYIVGGAEKLFKHFVDDINPDSIISYCDNSKFSGEVYERIGLIQQSFGNPTRHWYNPKIQKHVTENLLRQRGFDQLFGDIFGYYGKGTNNNELMLQNGFVEIYDCGQSVFTWRK